jgi:hypothetical protein
MNIAIRVRYISPAGNVTQGGTFPLRGRSPEHIAFEWIQQIKRQIYYEGLIEVVVNVDQDITKEVKALLNE